MYISRIEITKPAYSSKVQEITMILEESSIREFIILQSVIYEHYSSSENAAPGSLSGSH